LNPEITTVPSYNRLKLMYALIRDRESDWMGKKTTDTTMDLALPLKSKCISRSDSKGGILALNISWILNIFQP
jgi:hypothetical protein